MGGYNYVFVYIDHKRVPSSVDEVITALPPSLLLVADETNPRGRESSVLSYQTPRQ